MSNAERLLGNSYGSVDIAAAVPPNAPMAQAESLQNAPALVAGADDAAQRLALIVASSDDAIISKDLNGVIVSWNGGAERLFGYTAEEAIGRPVNMLIPPERQNEEPHILGRIRRGEKVDHYETVRQRKDGSLIDISLSVSPLKDSNGQIIGASKIARDISDRRRAEEQQQLLLREMDHRVKNAFTLAGSIVALSARSATTPKELASVVGDRLKALALGHSLTLPHASGTAEHPTGLHALVRTIVAPYDGTEEGLTRVAISGPDVAIAGRSVTSLALLLHEFATNAAKYGALSTHDGYVDISCSENGDQFVLDWVERGGPRVERTDVEGFGTLLGRLTVKSQLDGTIARDWQPEGLTIHLSVSRNRLLG